MTILKFLISALLFSASVFAGFYPVNRGMVNESTVHQNDGATTTLIATQNQIYIIEGGVSGSNIRFPNATLLPAEWWYEIFNNSTGTVTASDGAGAAISTIAPSRIGKFILKDRSTAAGSWKFNTLLGPTDLTNYYTKSEHIATSAGGADAGKPIVLNGSGQVDASMIPTSASGITTIGAFDTGVTSSNGASVSGTSLFLQSAAPNLPGLVSTSNQSFAGNKTFTGTIAASNLSGTNTGDAVTGSNANGLVFSGQTLELTTASAGSAGALSAADWTTFNSKLTSVTTSNIDPWAVTSEKLAPGAVSLTGVAVTGTLPVGNGGTGITSVPSNGQLLIGNGTNYTAATLTGTANAITVTNSAGGIQLATPQAIGTTSTPTFAALSLTSPLTAANGGTGSSSLPAAGQIPIATSANVYAPAYLTAGSNITITSGSNSIVIASTASGSGTLYAWNGFHASNCAWSTTSGTFVTPSGDSSCGLVQVLNSNFGTVSSVQSGGNNSSGISFTVPGSGEQWIEACASFGFWGATASTPFIWQLFADDATFGGVTASNGNYYTASLNQLMGYAGCGIGRFTGGGTGKFTIQIASGSGTLNLGNNTGSALAHAIHWSLKVLK